MNAATGVKSAEENLDVVLRNAHVSLDAGKADEAREGAHSVLRAAEERGDRLFQARALAFLAHCDRLVSRFRRAHDASQRAAHLFKTLGDVHGEALALATLTYVASCLGRNEDAVEAGLLCVRLSEHVPGDELRALAHNNLGVAYFWSRRFDKATAAFEAALRLARVPESRVSPFQPALNLACAESFRLITERYLTGVAPDAAKLCGYVEQALRENRSNQPTALQGGMLVTVKAMSATYSALAKNWSHDISGAIADLNEARSWADKYQTTTWLHAMEQWVRAEIAWTQRDIAAAEHFIAATVRIAAQVEHEQLACVAHMMLAQLHEVQGRPDLAMTETRALRRRENQIRAESLESRERVVKWQLEVRESERTLEVLKTASRQFERMSLEDPLTGIANRRCLEQKLTDLLAGTMEPSQDLAVGFIDVDRFKHVNDTYSHQVGDEVLKKLAEILSSGVREHDLAARLAGDEFVLVFPRTAATHAEQVCERIREAVLGFDWGSIAPGLRVSISVGVSQAGPDDTVALLLSRSDERMYAQKARTTNPQ